MPTRKHTENPTLPLNAYPGHWAILIYTVYNKPFTLSAEQTVFCKKHAQTVDSSLLSAPEQLAAARDAFDKHVHLLQ